MAQSDKRSYNNVNLGTPVIAALKKKSTKLSQVQIKVGSKKIELPVEAFLLTVESGAGFLSLQPINAVIQAKADNSYEAVLPKMADEAVSALKSYRPKGAAKKSARKAPDMNPELVKMLNSIPKGYKLVLKGSEYTLVKSREKKSK